MIDIKHKNENKISISSGKLQNSRNLQHKLLDNFS